MTVLEALAAASDRFWIAPGVHGHIGAAIFRGLDCRTNFQIQMDELTPLPVMSLM